ncbi:MAG: hypothetical protein ACK415_07230 [Thermodesulfovibrionales bacterium]
MILNPAIIALLLSSFLLSGMILYSAYFGLQILRRWDIKSGSETQLGLERRTYLISTILSYAFAFQLVSLFLFIYTADNLHTIFSGAMCAAGTFNVNRFGYPALILKIISFLTAGLWLILNHADNRGYDYPLIKKKYLLLIIISPVFLTEAVIITIYLLSLRADVITSCCGALFSSQKEGLISEIVSLPPSVARFLFFTSIPATILSGLYFYKSGKGIYIFSSLSVMSFIISIVSIISFISLYIYELPTHHCPFCILQKEYNYIGYPIYTSLLIATICGAGAGALNPFRNRESLKEIIPPLQKRLSIVSSIAYVLLLAVTVYEILTSDFRL